MWHAAHVLIVIPAHVLAVVDIPNIFLNLIGIKFNAFF